MTVIQQLIREIKQNMAISKIKDIVSWMKGHNHLPASKREEYIKDWAEELIDECAQVADEWKSVTPGFTKGYVETVKQQL